MPDAYASNAKSVSDPATKHFAITPSDGTDLTTKPRALYVSTNGNVAIRDEDGTSITYAVTAGQILPFRATRVLATGTTATVVGWI